MKICFIADARSPIALNWIRYFESRGHELFVLSSYPCRDDILSRAHLVQVPLGIGKYVSGKLNEPKESKFSPAGTLIHTVRQSRLAGLFRDTYYHITPFVLYHYARAIREHLSDISPDVVHAMRIPFEGIIANEAIPSHIPLLVSVWGNDFTLFAEKYRMISHLTKKVLSRTNALHCDCYRDLKIAQSLGFNENKPSLVVPTAGGIQSAIFNNRSPEISLMEALQLPEHATVIINPRGFREYMRNEMFFESIPLVIEREPNTVFLCSGMEGNPRAEAWVKQLGISENVRLLPQVPHHQMADLFRIADITVSPSTHDGTPNSLLEAMACGCFPVAGDIESVREWIEHGVNGLLSDLHYPEELAQVVLEAIGDNKLRQRATDYNLELIAERAEYGTVMAQVEQLYYQLVD